RSRGDGPPGRWRVVGGLRAGGSHVDGRRRPGNNGRPHEAVGVARSPRRTGAGEGSPGGSWGGRPPPPHRPGGRGVDLGRQVGRRPRDRQAGGPRPGRPPPSRGRGRGGRPARAGADDEYESALRDAGVWRPGDAPEVVAARIASSDVSLSLVNALDGWADLTWDVARRERILQVTRRADPDPGGWRS